MNRKRRALLVNPWITDFAAYDFWLRPLGLLMLGAALRGAGFEVTLVDCLDRAHPSVSGAVMRRRAAAKTDAKLSDREVLRLFR